MMNWKSRSLLFAALMLAVAFACDKEDPQPAASDAITGKWALESVSGGITGKGYVPPFNTIEFSGGKNYQLSLNGVKGSKGEYELYDKDKDKWIHFKPENQYDPIPFEVPDKKVTVDKDHLILTDPCCDQYEYHFNKDIR